MMHYIELIQYIGRHDKSVAKSLCAAINGEAESIDDDIYIYSHDMGIEYLVRGNTVKSLKLFSETNSGGFSRYVGEMPFNIEWGMTRPAIRELIGDPVDFSNGNNSFGIDSPPTDKYVLNDKFCYLSYSINHLLLTAIGIQLMK